MGEIEQLRGKLTLKQAEHHAARKEAAKWKAEQAKATSLLIAIEQARAVAQAVAEEVQEQAHKRIADVVSRSLEAVFDEPYEFKIIFEQKRGRTEARLVFMRDGEEVDPMTASGGGVVEVASFALRVSCLMLSRPPLRRLLVLDEPFRFVSAEYRDRVRQLVEQLAKEMGIQFIIVTHQEELRAGKIIQL